MKQTIEEKLNAEQVIEFDPFKKKESRADLTYSPANMVKDLKDVLYTGDLSKKENRDNLANAIGNYL